LLYSCCIGVVQESNLHYMAVTIPSNFVKS